MENIKETFDFHALKREEILELAKLASKVFTTYDPFLVEIQVDDEDLYPTIKSDLEAIVDDNLVLAVRSNKTNKLVGAWAGITLSKYFSKEPKNKTILEDINLPKNIKELSYQQKSKYLDKIDKKLLIPVYLKHKEKNELKQAIFCDYFFVSDDYFGTDLAKQIVGEFFKLVTSNGIKHGYGSFFNPKAVKLMTGYGASTIHNQLNIYLGTKEDGNSIKFISYLIGGDLIANFSKASKANEKKANF